MTGPYCYSKNLITFVVVIHPVNSINNWKDNSAAIFEVNFEALFVGQPEAPSSVYLTRPRRNS